MHYPRPNFPHETLRINLAAGLSLLASHITRDIETFLVQEDKSALLPVDTLRKLAQDFLEAPRDSISQNEPFFFEEERHSFTTALIYMANYQDAVGRKYLIQDLEGLLGDKATRLLVTERLEEMGATLPFTPSIQSESPHAGDTLFGVPRNYPHQADRDATSTLDQSTHSPVLAGPA